MSELLPPDPTLVASVTDRTARITGGFLFNNELFHVGVHDVVGVSDPQPFMGVGRTWSGGTFYYFSTIDRHNTKRDFRPALNHYREIIASEARLEAGAKLAPFLERKR